MTKQNSKQLPHRSKIPVEYTWRLEDIFDSDQSWNEEFEQVKMLIPKMSQYKGTLGNSAETLLAALKFQDHLLFRLGKLYTYAHMRYDQDTTNSHYQALNDRAKRLYTDAASEMSFIVPEILTISEEKLQSFIQENHELRVYKHALDQINQKRPHVLSEAEESLLAQASEVMSSSANTFGMLNNADLRFPTIIDEDG
ncbi:MAG: oligoendopeptidase F, partial [Thermoactinomyces sp.]